MDKIKIGKFIAECRKELNYSQKDLADKLCVTDKAVSKWETGKSLPDVTMMIPLADTLNVSVVEILNGEKTADENMKSVSNEVFVKLFGKKLFNRIKAVMFFPIMVLYIITAIHYIMGRIYVYHEFLASNKFILGKLFENSTLFEATDITAAEKAFWDFWEMFYYQEAAGITFIMAFISLVVMTFVILFLYWRELSVAARVLVSTLTLPPLLYAVVAGSGEHRLLILSAIAVCIVHTVFTTIFLIRDVKDEI